MKITIPKEYRQHFDNSVYVSRWQNKTLLLMNEVESEKLIKALETLKTSQQKGFVRFVQAGIMEFNIVDGKIDILQEMVDYTEQKELFFHKIEDKIMLSTEDNIQSHIKTPI